MESLTQATANVSGYDLEEIMKRGKHRASQWAYVGVYTGVKMGGRLTDLAELFNRHVASAFQGCRRVEEQIVDNEELQDISNKIREEVKELAKKRE